MSKNDGNAERRVVAALPGQGWRACFREDGRIFSHPLVGWLVWDDGTVEPLDVDRLGAADNPTESSNFDGLVTEEAYFSRYAANAEADNDGDPFAPTLAANCIGCGQSALKAFPPDEAPRPGAEYICHHCWENGTRPTGNTWQPRAGWAPEPIPGVGF